MPSSSSAGAKPASGHYQAERRTSARRPPGARRRRCLEEGLGIVAGITGFLGVYTHPNHIVAYTDGEIRLQYENTYIGRPVGGEPTINDEADGVRFVRPADLDQYDIHPSMRQQIGDYLAGTFPYLGWTYSTRATEARISSRARQMNLTTKLSSL